MVKQISDKTDVDAAIEIIVEKAKGLPLGEEFYQKARSVSCFLFLINCVSQASKCYYGPLCRPVLWIPISGFSDLTEFLDCRILTLLRYSNENSGTYR